MINPNQQVSKVYARCSTCKNKFYLTRDGVFIRHSYFTGKSREVCPGSGKKPLQLVNVAI